jgi:ParB family transcriptional regulator, chromosome partitioning protein
MKPSPTTGPVRTGTFQEFSYKQLKPNPQNPRRIFDKIPLKTLEESIRANGILVPLTVYQEKRTQQHYILDGERRWRCAEVIETDSDDPRKVPIPANVVDPPDAVANILWMFNIHNLREQWDLMPTALSLGVLINHLDETDDKRLSELTKLSAPQLKRCKVLLSYDKKYHALMMDPDPENRIKANFFIELYPVLELLEKMPQRVRGGKSRDEIIKHFLTLYRNEKIPSVIHFRRILEANDYLTVDGEKDEAKEEQFRDALRTLVNSDKYTIRKLFDPLTAEDRSIVSAQKLCSQFLDELEALKVAHVVKRAPLQRALLKVQKYVSELLTKLEG